MNRREPTWFEIANVDDIPSPAFLVYPDRIESNIRRLVALVGDLRRLRPQVKTHKMAEVVRLQQMFGIEQFKCATIAEAEMVGGCGARHVLLAYQPVGPNVNRLVELIKKFPRTRFATIVDDPATLYTLSAHAAAADQDIEVLLDVDCGMHRTGIAPGPGAVELYRLICSLPKISPGGLHAYDGHINDYDPATRTSAAKQALSPVLRLHEQLAQAGLDVPRIVAGGTPTFPFHAGAAKVECSPGTCILWDAGYASTLPDLEFFQAALVLTRVISKPAGDRLCLDLGHKAIASENPHPRVQLLELPDAVAVMHNEEHLVIQTSRAAEFIVGDHLYGIPWHICPTVALHAFAVVVRAGRADERWRVVARDRQLTI